MLTIITSQPQSQEKLFLHNKVVPVILTLGTSFLSSQPEGCAFIAGNSASSDGKCLNVA